MRPPRFELGSCHLGSGLADDKHMPRACTGDTYSSAQPMMTGAQAPAIMFRRALGNLMPK